MGLRTFINLCNLRSNRLLFGFYYKKNLELFFSILAAVPLASGKIVFNFCIFQCLVFSTALIINSYLAVIIVKTKELRVLNYYHLGILAVIQSFSCIIGYVRLIHDVSKILVTQISDLDFNKTIENVNFWYGNNETQSNMTLDPLNGVFMTDYEENIFVYIKKNSVIAWVARNGPLFVYVETIFAAICMLAMAFERYRQT